jgi:hypothetical protein
MPRHPGVALWLPVSPSISAYAAQTFAMAELKVASPSTDAQLQSVAKSSSSLASAESRFRNALPTVTIFSSISVCSLLLTIVPL